MRYFYLTYPAVVNPRFSERDQWPPASASHTKVEVEPGVEALGVSDPHGLVEVLPRDAVTARVLDELQQPGLQGLGKAADGGDTRQGTRGLPGAWRPRR